MGDGHDDRGAEDNVVDAARWLEDGIEHLLDDGAYGRAMQALNRLLAVAEDTETKLYCYENIGVLAFQLGDVDEARQAFLQATELSATDPGLSYALGHCAAAQANWWRALLHYLTAAHHARDLDDQAEFMRVGALAMQRLGFPDTALAMLLGALDRSADNPWILEAISQLYEYEQRWFEALDVQEALIDVLADGIPHARGPSSSDERQVDRIVRKFMSLWTIDREAIRRRVEAITERLRNQIGVVRDGEDRPDGADMGLTPLNLPAGLHLLVEQLAMHERNYLLLETAQSLWAQARHDRFDIHLTPYTLAAAIQSIAERLHWRVPTSFDELGDIYGAEPDTIQAAARVLVGRYGVGFIPEKDIYGGLSRADSSRLVNIQRAILYGVDVSHLESGVTMLGE